MESYIVRIYRRDEEKPRVFTGIVEIPGVEDKHAFGSADELWDILTHAKKDAMGGKENI